MNEIAKSEICPECGQPLNHNDRSRALIQEQQAAYYGASFRVRQFLKEEDRGDDRFMNMTNAAYDIAVNPKEHGAASSLAARKQLLEDAFGKEASKAAQQEMIFFVFEWIGQRLQSDNAQKTWNAIAGMVTKDLGLNKEIKKIHEPE